MIRFILASASPRRKKLLEQLGIMFDVVVSDADEEVEGNPSPEDFVRIVSKRKAESVANTVAVLENNEKTVVIAADTIVYINGRILGKPKDYNEAFEMLKALSGNIHTVYTGLTVAKITCSKEEYCNVISYVQQCCATNVVFRSLTNNEINDYILTGEPFDKAGAYAIQEKGSLLIEKTDGDFHNIVGLPILTLHKLLADEKLL